MPTSPCATTRVLSKRFLNILFSKYANCRLRPLASVSIRLSICGKSNTRVAVLLGALYRPRSVGKVIRQLAVHRTKNFWSTTLTRSELLSTHSSTSCFEKVAFCVFLTLPCFYLFIVVFKQRYISYRMRFSCLLMCSLIHVWRQAKAIISLVSKLTRVHARYRIKSMWMQSMAKQKKREVIQPVSAKSHTYWRFSLFYKIANHK